MNTQIFIDTRNTAKPVPLSDGVYAQHLEEMRLVALDLIELLARERARTFEGVGASFWLESDRVLDKTRKLLRLAEQRAASLADGSFRR